MTPKEKAEKALNIAIQEAKKEVFDDIDKLLFDKHFHKDIYVRRKISASGYSELKKRHLLETKIVSKSSSLQSEVSTFAEQKQHNIRKIQLTDKQIKESSKQGYIRTPKEAGLRIG